MSKVVPSAKSSKQTHTDETKVRPTPDFLAQALDALGIATTRAGEVVLTVDDNPVLGALDGFIDDLELLSHAAAESSSAYASPLGRLVGRAKAIREIHCQLSEAAS